jgi:hypothetical protein
MSGLVGFGLAILSLPLSLFSAAFPQGEPSMPAWEIISFVLGSGILVASGFIMFSLGWPKNFTKSTFRRLNFLFLLFSLVVGFILINSSRAQFPLKEIAIIFSTFTSWLLLLCIKPNLLR